MNGSKVWHSNSKYRRTIWQCNNKYKTKGKCSCQTPHINEATIQNIFIQAFNQIYAIKTQLTNDYDDIISILTDTTATDQESDVLREECRVVAELIQQCVSENARVAQNQAEYQKRYNALYDRYEAVKTRLDMIAHDRHNKAAKREVILQFLAEITQQDGLLTEFDERLWYTTIESITIHSEKEVAVTFKDGSIIKADASKV